MCARRAHYWHGPGDGLRTCWVCGVKLLESKAVKIDGKFRHPRCVQKVAPGEGQGEMTGLNWPGGTGPGTETITYNRIWGMREGFEGYRTEEDYKDYNSYGYKDPNTNTGTLVSIYGTESTSKEGFKGRMMCDDCRY